MCCQYYVDFSFSQDDCDTMVYGLASKHFGISNLYLQLSVAVIALGNPANRERKISVLPAGGIAAKEGVSTFGGMEWWNGIVEWTSGMDYWNGGMLYRTYLIIQHVLCSEQ